MHQRNTALIPTQYVRRPNLVPYLPSVLRMRRPECKGGHNKQGEFELTRRLYRIE
jgi:hypothetical protein